MEELRNGRAQQILLNDGDTVNVPKAQTFIVNGFVRAPNTYVLEGDITVQKAIAMAGGVTERGALSRTKIQRMVDGKLVEIKARMTDLVQPNDTHRCAAAILLTVITTSGSTHGTLGTAAPDHDSSCPSGRLYGGIERMLTRWRNAEAMTSSLRSRQMGGSFGTSRTRRAGFISSAMCDSGIRPRFCARVIVFGCSCGRVTRSQRWYVMRPGRTPSSPVWLAAAGCPRSLATRSRDRQPVG